MTASREPWVTVAGGPSRRPRAGPFERPRQPPERSFRSFLQALDGGGTRVPRSFGGWCSSFRCERAAADLLFLICDLGAGGSASWVPAQASAAAERFGFEVRVELIEKAEGTGGREVFAIREVHGRAF